VNPKKAPAYQDDPSFRNAAVVRDLLGEPLPPLPPVAQLELAEGGRQKRAGRALPKDEERARFLQYNAARREHVRTGEPRWQRRATHWEDFLTRANLPLIPFAFHKYARYSPGIKNDPDAVFSSGTLGLLRAVRSFNVGKGFAFSTFAVRVLINTWSAERARTAIRLTRMPTYTMNGVSGERALQLAAPDAPDPLTEERQQLYDVLRDNAAHLTTQERLVLQHRFLGGEAETLDAVAKRMAISKERVRQVAAKATEKLRRALCRDD
jgi:RNA polymerase sigma factor (sigma-70 family)